MIDLSRPDVEDPTLALVRSVSHAVLNDLAVVRLLLDVSRDPEVAADPETGLDAAAARVARVGTVVQQLGTLARGPDGVATVDLRDVLADIDQLLAVAAGARNRLVLDLPPVPVPAAVDGRRVQQRVLAMVVDVAAGLDTGTIVVRAHPGGQVEVVDEVHGARRASLASGEGE